MVRVHLRALHLSDLVIERENDMKAGTLIRLADGREGRVVYNGLDGVGIKWGRDPVDVAAIMRGDGGLFDEPDPEQLKWAPEAMLRDPYPGADLECVGREFEVVED
jgi:hypothetical protein